MKKNGFVKFYKEYGGVLDLKGKGDLQEHMQRRIRLYDLIGLSQLAFRNINILV